MARTWTISNITVVDVLYTGRRSRAHISYAVDPDGYIVGIVSIGPTKIPDLHLEEFKAGKLPAMADYQIDETVAYKEWEVDRGAYEKYMASALEIRETPRFYTPTRHCTTAALELLNKVGVPRLPSGISQGVFYEFPMLSPYGLGEVVNPYALLNQIGETKISDASRYKQ